jgi:chitin synthase
VFPPPSGLVGIEGWNYQVSNPTPTSLSIPANAYGGTDETPLFDRSDYKFPACDGIKMPFATVGLCTSPTQGNASSCTLRAPSENYLTSQLHLTNTTKRVGYAWEQLANFTNFMVIDGNVLNLTPYINAHPTPLNNDTVDAAIRYMLNTIDTSGGKDATRLFYNDNVLKSSVDCLVQRYQAGHIDKVTPGCFVSNLFLYVSLILIMGIVLARFAMACIFSWYLAGRMIKPPKNLKRNVISPAVLPEGANIDVDNTTGAAPWTEAAVKRQQTRRLQKGATRKGRSEGDLEKPLPRSHSDAVSELDAALPVNPDGMISMASIGAELFCVCLVTCYSEGAEGIKITLDSIAGTTYSDARKLMFVVCDGMITGSGEKMSTPDICVGMIERDPRFGDPTPMSYVAVADGSKAHNQAMVYAGHYSTFRFHPRCRLN